MDHLPNPVRSRSSQTASPSQSVSASASVSATSSLHKRKLPPSDDLDSVSVPGAEDSEADSDSEEDDDSSIRNFTASRLDKSNTKVNAAASVKPEATATDGAKDGVGNSNASNAGNNNNSSSGNAVANGGAAGTLVKEDVVKGMFTDNIQTSGAYSAREEALKREEEAGRLKFLCASNDGIDQHMVWLIGLKNIFSKQLPNMPKEYIVRLLMDRNHKSVMVIRRNIVVGGITYRPYRSQKFGEIAFCAITADEQVKGYGTRLMNHLKQHARDEDGLTHFLTYADNNAVGYFVKQGFTKEIFLEKERWHGYIKDYDGGILMECKIDPKLPYTDLSTMIRRQRQAIDEKIRELSNCHIIYPGIDFQKKEAGVPKKLIKVEDVPGLKDAGWTPDQYGYSQIKTMSSSADAAAHQKSLTAFMRSLVKAMHDHPDAWPFKEPVDARDVPDYYDIIKDPMDLKTMLKRVESEQFYVTLEMFKADVRRMFSNARTYNSPDTIYYKCSTRLESHFSSKFELGLQSGTKIQP